MFKCTGQEDTEWHTDNVEAMMEFGEEESERTQSPSLVSELSAQVSR